MPLRNRVTPLGELIADPARGLVFGNRGCLHADSGDVIRSYNGRRWIACQLEFRGRRRAPLLRPGRYTELFFLDEATAFAAGHRPCAECRRPDYVRFVEIWRELHPGQSGADAIDAQLHAERLDRPTAAERLDRATAAERLDRATAAERLDRATGAERLDRAMGAERLDRAMGAERLDRAMGAERLDRATAAERLDRATRGEPHAEPQGRARSAQRHHQAPFEELPDGALVLRDGEPWLVLGTSLRRWTPAGYRTRRPRPPEGRALVITPPSLLSVLRAGWQSLVPLLHPSADPQPASPVRPAGAESSAA